MRQQLAAGDVNDPLLVPVPLEELVAVGEEAGVRQAVVLEDYRLVDLREDPVEPAGNPPLQPQILVGEVADDLAGPVDPLEPGARPLALARLLVVSGPRPVRDQEQPVRTRLANPLEDPAGLLRTPE